MMRPRRDSSHQSSIINSIELDLIQMPVTDFAGELGLTNDMLTFSIRVALKYG